MSVLKCPSSSVTSSTIRPQMSHPQVPVLNCRHAEKLDAYSFVDLDFVMPEVDTDDPYSSDDEQKELIYVFYLNFPPSTRCFMEDNY
uniref:Uncharacterized protein n=1 Tax=Acrobeloides nanus TaxID=290746 RepID=A0A914CPW8_9BILA